MDIKTIRQLNELNQRFYQTVAEEFDQTRQGYWEGWEKLIPYLRHVVEQHGELRVLDVGCGNGRFGEFLHKHFPTAKIEYTGVDSTEALLAKAITKLTSLPIKISLEQADIIELVLANKWLSSIQPYNVITLFGLLHHLPSLELRTKVLKNCFESLTADGLLCLTAWQFADDARFDKKLIRSENVGVTQKQLESNDFILDWQSEATAFRYAHNTTETELKSMLKTLKISNCTLFRADGKNHQLNLYAACRSR